MTDSNLKSIVEGIESLEAQQKALSAEKRAIYAEAKNANINTKALREIVAARRMPDREQIEADMHNYRIMLGMAVNDVANGASLREAAAKSGIPKSTLHDAVRREEKFEAGQSADDGLDLPDFLRRQRSDPPSA